MKKAQIKQSFTAILFILIAAVVIILGYQGIQSIMGQSCQAEKATFKNKLVGFFDKYDDYGSVHEETLSLPCDYKAICFVNSSVSGNSVQISDTKGAESAVLDTAITSQQNIFLVGEYTEAFASSPKVEVPSQDSGYTALCIRQSGGVVDLTFKGQGQTTLVEG